MNTLQEFLEYTAGRFGDLEAYSWLEENQIVSRTYTQWKDDVARMACMIADRFGTGKKIALVGDTSYAWIVAYYGIMISSNVSVPLDVKLSAREIVERLDFADVSIVLLSEKCMGMKEEIEKLSTSVEQVVLLFQTLEQSASMPIRQLEPVNADALSSLMFTSGTSGDGLKAAMISQRMILADVTGPVPLCVPGDRLLSVLPIHHCFEIFVGQMKYLYLGATICINDAMTNLLPNLTRFGITIVVAVPALANMLAGFIAANRKTKDMDTVKKMLGGKLRRITIGGACCSKEVIDTLADAGITVFVGYGLTESTGGCLANCDASIHPFEAGKPYVEGMEMKLEDGDLCLKGPMVMQGYYKSPELTRKVIQDGWLHTGDIAEITNEGYVIILGRKDNMIKTSNGEKVYPEAWESRLLDMPEVASAMVAEVHDRLAAILFLQQDTEENRNKTLGMIKKMNVSVPGYEKIVDVLFRDKPFPMTTSLKIKRGEVMKEISHVKSQEETHAPENEAQRRILEKAREILPGARIGIDDNLFEKGLDSLSALSLAILLDCEPNVIFSAKTIRKIAEGNEESKETKIPDINRYIHMDPRHCGIGDTVLLTGASGYLGSHLLHALLQHGHHVVALVRSLESFHRSCSYYGLVDERDVELVIGDVTKEHLGLEEETWKDLCGRVDSVFHAAALVAHAGDAGASMRVNVEGTRQVILFSKASGASLFHMSSYAVCGFKSDKILDEDVLDIGQEIRHNPYIETKYKAEEQVLLAREEVSSTIFRIGNLAPRSRDGLFQINPEESGMAAQIRAFKRLGCCPQSMANMPYDQTAVDDAARAIVLLAEKQGTGNVWHIMNPSLVLLKDMVNAQTVDDNAFANLLSQEASHRDVAILSIYCHMRQLGFHSNFSFSKTQQELEKLGFAWNKNK